MSPSLIKPLLVLGTKAEPQLRLPSAHRAWIHRGKVFSHPRRALGEQKADVTRLHDGRNRAADNVARMICEEEEVRTNRQSR